MPFPELTITLPDWMSAFLADQPELYPTVEDRMRLAIGLARKNITEGTGGPFGAAVFDQASGRLVSVGVNRVVPLGLSMAHAELIALSFAQQQMQRYSLGSSFDLFTSAQMCAMCMGGVLWAGVGRVVCGATSEDVEQLAGFDEGPIHPDWIREMQTRGITVQERVLRQEACAVLRQYRDLQGEVYNG